ncbi:MAG: hypothetical protein ABSH05_22625 [Bryobacteraceae bacterium]|jgi:DNA-directed RNA polymerase subunit RPC12/RpoP
MSEKKETGLSGGAILLIGALIFIGAIAILIWLFGIVITLIVFGIGLGALVLWVVIGTKKVETERQDRWDKYDRIACPKCGRTLGSRMEMRRQVGSFKPTASIGGSARCPHCGSEFYLSL